MLGAIFLAFATLFLYRLLGGVPQLRLRRQPSGGAGASKIEELTEHARRLRAGNRYTAAEKVYLQILKIDHHHVPTYSRLGTLYSAMRNYGDAIECFKIAAQLSPSGSTNYNLGLGYFENRNYPMAVEAFEKAVMFEPTMQRYVGLAKACDKAGNSAGMISALEHAVNIESNPKVLWLLVDAYEAAGRADDAQQIRERIKSVDPRNQRLRARGTVSTG